ncbi:type II toxin-antitoxin system VapC family toxin [Ensifer sp. ENS04]|uniref:PIN domain-containing protein n=1 Tax=Ensifer sp. ENS04 TaxID=2769281 RepID=UPI00177CEC06|nr:PIN domain-containing protein [Ensifer sp. ENS04]MBD9538932.1 type II toxin-antitoxin system VapC family toxin [Ensifer sp. ENS04]
MLVFLLDTNVISGAQKKQPQPALAAWLKRQSTLAIPFPVILEIEIGIVEVSATNPRKAAELRRWRDELLETDFIYPAVTPAVARQLAAMQCCRPLKNLWCVDQRSEKHMPGQDLFIAAISIANTMPIATIDRGDFMLIHRYFPLPGLYDPIQGTWLVSPVNGFDATTSRSDLQR